MQHLNLLLTKLFRHLIRGYQLFVSPMLPPRCRFQPTCSAYALEALQLHGPFKGLYLTCRRLLRCHPFCKCGYDPVPQPHKKT